MSTVADLALHPQLRRSELRTQHGTVEIPAAPAIFDRESPAFGRVPALDEHGSAIRREFGGSANGA